MYLISTLVFVKYFHQLAENKQKQDCGIGQKVQFRNLSKKGKINSMKKTLLTLFSIFGFGVLGVQSQNLEYYAGMYSSGLGTIPQGPVYTVGGVSLKTSGGRNPVGYPSGLNVTATLSNQQYNSIATTIDDDKGVMMGIGFNTSLKEFTSVNSYVSLNNVGSPINTMYSATSDSISKGINRNTNFGFNIFTTVEALDDQPDGSGGPSGWVLASQNATNGTYYYGNITFTFSSPVTNPVIHLTGLGGYTSIPDGGLFLPFNTDYTLTTSGLSLTKLSGSNKMQLESGTNRIYSSYDVVDFYLNSVVNTDGQNTGTGSFRINGTNITSVTFAIQVRGLESAVEWTAASGEYASDAYNGDRHTVSFSIPNKVDIAGTVYADGNGITGGINDKTGTNAGGKIYAVLIGSDNKVAGVTAVASNGTYSFSGAPVDGYKVQLDTFAPAIGSAAPTVTIPFNWVITGENYGSGTGTDGTPDSKLTLTIPTDNIVFVNFGIQQKSTATTLGTTMTVSPQWNSFTTLDGLGGNPPALQGYDPEDQPANGSLANKTVRILTLPTNGELWYNGTQITAATTLTNFNPSLLQFKATGLHYTSTSFTYSYIDNANVEGSPATYGLDWAIPLPVKLVSFTGSKQTEGVQLVWVAEQETNFDRYVVERSTNGVDFESIGEVVGSGKRTYSMLDRNPAIGKNYYRLVMLDKDGNTEKSKIVTIVIDRAVISMNIWPNPAHDVLNISLSGIGSELVQVRMVNAAGQVVMNGSHALTALGKLELNTQEIKPGVYTLMVVVNGEVKTAKVMIQ